MQILSVRILEGPNIYNCRPVLRITLDIGQYDNLPSSRITGFNQHLLKLLPGLTEHCCSRGYPGGFVERLTEGTYLAHIFEHVLIELQCMAGYAEKFGKTRGSGQPGIYDIVVGYSVADAAVQAVYEAEKLFKVLLQGAKNFAITTAISNIRRLGEQYRLGPSTKAIYDAAVRQGIPVNRVGNESLLILGYGCRQERVWATITSKTSTLATDLSCDKYLTNKILVEHNIPVPYNQVAENIEQASQIWRQIGKGVVAKPVCGNQGKGVTININNLAELERAFSIAREYEPRVLI